MNSNKRKFPDSSPGAFIAKRKLCFSVIAALCALLPLVIIFSAGFGALRLSAGEVARILLGRLSGKTGMLDGISAGAAAVVFELRFPRILCAAFTGAALSAAGVIFQAILQNPLADPYTLGVSTGAAFGASLAIFLNMAAALTIPPPLSALIFSGLTLVAVLAVANRGSGLVTANLIMAGIIVSAVLQAGVSFLKMASGENVGAIVFWLMGSLSGRSWPDALLLAPVTSAAVFLAILFSRDLNLLSLGSRGAESLGLNVKRARLLYLLLGAALTAFSVSVCGVIGFVGLVVPHLLRFSLTPDNRLLLPLAALSGALLLTLADNAVRLIGSGEIPVGVLTTLLGGPFFIYIFIRRKGAARE
ncbi:MAG: iron ABC transporter permease [Spirochaetaceae bacterium]|jgi:iron complex transport system permease protein|nr:iron ABC transporter permease [Spirochaetaceae bacterium]